MSDAARQAGVSISSVSRVTNNYPGVHPELRSQVDRAIKVVGYVPSPIKMRRQESGTRLIYFLLGSRDLHILFHSRVLDVIENECRRHKDSVLFRTLRYAPEILPEDLNIPQLLEVSFAAKSASSQMV